jgi:hypothetical protein
MEVEKEETRMQAKSQLILQALCDLTVSCGQYKSAVDFTIQVAAGTLGYNCIFTVVLNNLFSFDGHSVNCVSVAVSLKL